MTFTVGDLEKPLSGVCTDDGTPVDLTTATAVTVHVRRPDATVLTRAATVTTPATGVWSMPWQVGDLSLAGSYWCEVQVTWPGDRPQTFGPSRFNVRDQIA